MVANVRERLAVNKEAAQKFDGEAEEAKGLVVTKQYQIEITNRYEALWNISDDGDINRA